MRLSAFSALCTVPRLALFLALFDLPTRTSPGFGQHFYQDPSRAQVTMYSTEDGDHGMNTIVVASCLALGVPFEKQPLVRDKIDLFLS
jgi:hypothetical protein